MRPMLLDRGAVLHVLSQQHFARSFFIPLFIILFKLYTGFTECRLTHLTWHHRFVLSRTTRIQCCSVMDVTKVFTWILAWRRHSQPFLRESGSAPDVFLPLQRFCSFSLQHIALPFHQFENLVCFTVILCPQYFNTNAYLKLAYYIIFCTTDTPIWSRQFLLFFGLLS